MDLLLICICLSESVEKLRNPVTLVFVCICTVSYQYHPNIIPTTSFHNTNAIFTPSSTCLGGLEHSISSTLIGNIIIPSSSPLTNSHFFQWWLNHQEQQIAAVSCGELPRALRMKAPGVENGEVPWPWGYI